MSVNLNLKSLQALEIPYEIKDNDKNGVLSAGDAIVDAESKKTVTYAQAVAGIEAFLKNQLYSDIDTLKAIVPRQPGYVCYNTNANTPYDVLRAEQAYAHAQKILTQMDSKSDLFRLSTAAFNAAVDTVNGALALSRARGSSCGGYFTEKTDDTPSHYETYYDLSGHADFGRFEPPCKK